MGRAPRRKPNVAAARMIRWSLIVFLSEGRNGHYHSYRKSALDVEIGRGADGGLARTEHEYTALAERNRDKKTAAGMVFGASQDLVLSRQTGARHTGSKTIPAAVLDRKST